MREQKYSSSCDIFPWIIRIHGTVQSVGFRPYVSRLATSMGIGGTVRNNDEGVLIEVWAREEALEEFLRRLETEAPPLAQIENILIESGFLMDESGSQVSSLDSLITQGAQPERKERQAPAVMRIIESDKSALSSRTQAERASLTLLPSDSRTCSTCMSECLDPENRRYLYPFINCSDCGPRFSIIESLPYDRERTSMRRFGICSLCRAEYDNPLDRRFHCQSVSCARCGPTLSLIPSPDDEKDWLTSLCALLHEGRIVAVQGLGSFHLICDAANGESLRALRQAKNRPSKPFALLASSVATISRYAEVSANERILLESPASPILILKRKEDKSGAMLPDEVAPGMSRLGFMLPQSAMYQLIADRFASPLVCTSANLSGEPAFYHLSSAKKKLSFPVSHILYHDRSIVSRLDDSVIRTAGSRVIVLRSARGMSPNRIALPEGLRNQEAQMLCLGGDLKNAFSLVSGSNLIVSQYSGELHEPANFAEFQSLIEHYLELFKIVPQLIGADQHPRYVTSRYARKLGEVLQVPVESVQHHHAHFASCLLDNELANSTQPILAIVLDGLGYSEQGLWGGEVLLGNYAGSVRVASLAPVPLPGGEMAMKEPWRNTFAHLRRLGSLSDLRAKYGNLDLFESLAEKPLALMEQMCVRSINSPESSSCGRLFDAVAFALGAVGKEAALEYEGQAAIALESLICEREIEDLLAGNYKWQVVSDHELYAPVASGSRLLSLDPSSMWHNLLLDLAGGARKEVLAARFHFWLADSFTHLVCSLVEMNNCKQIPGNDSIIDLESPNISKISEVALSGGVFQNAVLLSIMCQLLESRGLKALTHRRLSANDGGIAAGQAVTILARKQAGEIRTCV